jgi:hypothetical protein
MKFLYVASERSDGQAAATALRGIGPNVTVFWVTQFDHAAKWLEKNRDVAACLVEPAVDAQSCAAFLVHIRGLGVTAPVIVIAPDVGFRLEWLKAGADDYIAKNHSLLRELPVVITRAMERAAHRNDAAPPRQPVHMATYPRPIAKVSEASEPGDRLVQSQAEFDTKLTALIGSKAVVERRLAEAEASFRQNEEFWTAERSAATERYAKLEETVERERTLRADLEQRLASTNTTLNDAEQQHKSAMAAAAQQLAECRAQHDITTARAAASWAMVDEQLREAAIEVERARQGQAAAVADVERLSRRESELSALLSALTSTNHALKGRLADAENAVTVAHERVARERLAAAEQTAARDKEFKAELDHTIDQLRTVEQQLSDAVKVREEAQQRFAAREAELTALLAEASASREALELRLSGAISAFAEADERATRERLAAARKAAAREAELDGVIRQERTTRSGVEQKLTLLAAALRDADQRNASAIAKASGERKEADERATAERRAAAERQADLEGALSRETEKRERVEADVTRAREKTVRLEDQMARERFGHESRAAEIKEQIRALSLERDTLQESIAALQKSVATLETQAERANTQHREERDTLLADHAKAVATLEAALSERDSRLNEQAAQLKEQAAEHAAALRSAESARALLQDGFRTTLAARNHEIEQLQAKATAAVEELDSARHRLDKAHRMEAVARLASEVAVTCSNLLRDVRHNTQEWLKTVGGDAAVRQQGEMVLSDVARAAGFLRQLAVYGDEQASALVPVDLNKVLRDLAPVLNRLAGDDVEIELPKTSASFKVDVKTPRVERLLVTLASYGRQRMPSGGRLRIELATVDLDQNFVEKYPNVRQGRHALMTVTEIRRAPRADDNLQIRGNATATGLESSSSDKPGVDLGVLQELIRECSGHLWMTIEPPGNMVAKIHLPLRTSDELARARTLVKRAVTALRAHSLSL